MIFDSDILIWVFRRDAQAIGFLEAHTKRLASIVSLMEVLAGARSKAELAATRSFFVEFGIELIPVSVSISYAAANLIEEHELSDGLDITDALIAATARETGETLATANYRHFRKIPDLMVHRFHPSRRA